VSNRANDGESKLVAVPLAANVTVSVNAIPSTVTVTILVTDAGAGLKSTKFPMNPNE
jgi:hypothetical protein